MQIKIGPNKSSLFTKIFIALILSAFVLSCIPDLQKVEPKHLLILLSMALADVLVLSVLYRLPIGITFDKSTKQIAIKYLLKRSVNFTLTDIKSFSYAKFTTRAGFFQGDYLYLNDGKKIFITNFSLKDHIPFEQYMEEEKVPYNGEVKARLLYYYFPFLARK